MKSTENTFVLFLILSFKELFRNKASVLLLFVVPATFMAITYVTSGAQEMPIKIFLDKEILEVTAIQRDISIIFMAMAVNAFMSSYFSLLVFHRNFDYFRYCAFNGLKPYHFLLGRFVFIVLVIVCLSAYSLAFLVAWLKMDRLYEVFIGILFTGIIYGAYGGIIGLVAREFLVAVFLIVLLVNIDPGWLQNPVFYTNSENIGIIKALPAHFPGQYIFTALFTKAGNSRAGIYMISICLVLMSVLFTITNLRLKKVYRNPG